MSNEMSLQKDPRGGVVRALRTTSEPSSSRNDAKPLSPRSRSKLWMVGALVLIVCSIAAYAASRWLLGPKIPVYVVTKENVLQTLVASGRVETPLRVDIGAQVVGKVATVPVDEGQSVESGQALVILEDGEAKASVAAARAAIAQAQMRVTQISKVALPAAEEALRRAQANQLNSLKQLERVRQLKAQDLVSQSQVDDADVAFKLADSELRSAQLQVATNSLSGSDYLLAQTSLQQAQANLDTALAKLRYTKITAPVAGTLIARNVERGDVVQPGKALMVLSPAGHVQLVVQIDEKNLSNLEVGQRALASADAYADRHFAAQVAYINPAVDADRGSVEVKLNVGDPPDYLRQDMTVSVDIEVARRDNTLTLAANAVHDANGSAPWVTKVNDGKALRQPVKVGARGTGKVEILEGLKADDLVLSSMGPPLPDGKRVRTVPASTQIVLPK